MMARTKSVYQNKRERIEKKIALKLFNKGYSTRVVAEMLKERGIVRSKMWVWRLVQGRNKITSNKK